MEKIIEVNNLSKDYYVYDKPIDRLYEVLHPQKKVYHQKVSALENVNFSIRKGETVGIIGKNGSGKSTLLKLITGIISPTEGRIEVSGRISAILELGAGFNLEYTGIENIYANAMLYGLSKTEVELKMNEIINFADIGEFIHYPVKTYSSGMYARLAFALAINVDPEILIVDEALSVGDMAFQHKCINKMKELIERGISVLFVSHDTYAIKSLCSRCIYLKKGKVVADNSSVEVTDMFLADVRKELYVPQDGVNDDSEEVFELSSVNSSYGTKDVQIMEVYSEDDNGNRKDFYDFGDTINFIMNIKANKVVDHLNCSLRIRDRNGIDITGTTSFEEKISLPQMEKDEYLSICFKGSNLLKHDMSFSVGATVSKTKSLHDHIILDHLDCAYTFKSLYNPDRPVWYAYYQKFDISYKRIE